MDAGEPRPMQRWSLTVDKFVDNAARWHGDAEIVSRRFDGSIDRTNWAELRLLAKRISNALLAEGIGAGDRVATLAMNGADHLAAWYGIMGIGALCHTLNPRLSGDQLAYMAGHAEDRLLFADREFAAIVDDLRSRCPSIRHVVWLDGDGEDGLPAFVAAQSSDCAWGNFDEDSPAGLCYTSGTTGVPKGVVYTHRSNYLHTMMILQPDVFDIGARDTWMPVVPMFHANAWGLAFATAAAGSKLVLPGRHLDGASLHNLIRSEGVNRSAGVPTVWQGLLDHIDAQGLDPSPLDRVFVGGSACSQALYERFAKHGVQVQGSWGMTEVSPLGTTASLTPRTAAMPAADQMGFRLTPGRPPMGVDLRIVDEAGEALAHDGEQPGHLQIRGHSVIDSYYRAPRSALTTGGFFDTGDIAAIDPLGYVRITDRAKDVIKSGGEWISSTDMEHAALAHPGVELAATIAVPDVKWGERPLLLVQQRPGLAVSREEVLALLAGQFARWQLPNIILFVEHIPLGPTGKLDKKCLRETFALRGEAGLIALGASVTA